MDPAFDVSVKVTGVADVAEAVYVAVFGAGTCII